MLHRTVRDAVRNLRRQGGYSLLNIAGLAIGIASFLLISLWIRDETGYDDHHDNAGRIYRVVVDFISEHGVLDFARTAPLYGPTLEGDFPEIELSTRFKTFGAVVKRGEKVFFENGIMVAEPSALRMFTFPLVAGDPVTALSKPKTVVLSEQMAAKYFGDGNPLGQVIVLDDTMSCTVTGVMANLPGTSHLSFDCLLSWETWRQRTPEKWMNTWNSNIYYTYIMLEENGDVDGLRRKLPAFADRYINGEGTRARILLQPLPDIHLHSHRRQELAPNGDIAYVYIFSAVALFVLAIACVNFTNLATARSIRRCKEVGLRKVVASRGQLIAQFMCESILVSALAVTVAVLMVELALPYFNDLSGKTLRMNSIPPPTAIAFLLGLTLAVGAAAGSYPAILLSRFRPAHLLKTPRRVGGIGAWTRKALIIFQFVVSTALIFGTLVVSDQLRYLLQQDPGFRKEQLVVLPFGWDARVQERLPVLKTDLLESPEIVGVAASGDVPGHMATTLSFRAEGMPDGQSSGIVALIIDPDFLDTYGIDLVAGHNFIRDGDTGRQPEVILNRKAVAEIGWSSPQAAIGKRFQLQDMAGRVTGVVDDFNFNSLRQAVEPLAMAVWPDWFGYITIRVGGGDIAGTIGTIEAAWKSLFPDQPFRYFFLDEQFDAHYGAVVQMEAILTIFTVLAILIACLGLLGLAAFTAEQRTKEIGIRKVLGASAAGIVLLLTKDFARLVLVAVAIAAPLAYAIMNHWLADFAYRITPDATTFLVTAGLAIGIALLTVSFQASRAAQMNPVKTIRNE